MKRKIIALFLCVLMVMSLAAPIASADPAETDDPHSGHVTHLDEILPGADCETDFCGRFFCEDCQMSYYAPISYEDVGMPVVNLKGSLDGISKSNKVTVEVDYSSADLSFASAATLKLQGSTSITFPKKNYSVQFLKDDGSKNKIKLVDDWGKQSKYCLKANWVDFSQARNVVSGQIYSQIIHSRGINDELNALPNGGAVDGFPVLVYLNGDLLGLYTMNIPKDKWMFGMKDETVRQALLFGNSWLGSLNIPSVDLTHEIGDPNDLEAYGWEMEYCSTEDDPEVGTAWAVESMNEFIRFLNENNLAGGSEGFKNGLPQYTDVDRAIDLMIYTYFAHACDNKAKNIIWATYDGVKWIPSVYDLDATWGLHWNGNFTDAPDDFMPDCANVLFEGLLINYKDELTARYAELRETVLSKANLFNMFETFIAKIPPIVYAADAARWPDVPSKDTNNLAQIESFIEARIAAMDEWYGVNVTEEPFNTYRASFDVPEGVTVLVYPSQDYSRQPVQAEYALSVTKDGRFTRDDGQINFTVVPPRGYAVTSVTASPDNYKNIKGPEETGLADTYRVTKMTGDLTVSVGIEMLPPELSLSASADTVALGKSVTFTASGFIPEGTYIVWTVSGSENYTVPEDAMSCTVTGKSVGNIKVTATLVNADGSPIDIGVTSASASARVSLLSAVEETIKTAVDNAVTTVKNIFNNIGTAVKNTFDKLFGFLK